MGFISIYAATKVAETARKSLESEGMTDEEIDLKTLRFVTRLVLTVVTVLVIIVLVQIVFSPQFCFMHDIREFYHDPLEWICK